MEAPHPNPPPFPDNIALAPGWWKSRNGIAFNIALDQDGKRFVSVNPAGMVDVGSAFVWHSDGRSYGTPIGDGDADQDFALVERVTLSTRPLPVVGQFVVAVIYDPGEASGWRVACYREGVPDDIWNHQPGVIATKLVSFVEGERK